MARREKKPWPLCSGLLKDGGPCSNVVARGDDGKPALLCPRHQRLAAEEPSEPTEPTKLAEPTEPREPVAVVDDLDEEEGTPAVPDSAPIQSIRAALRGDLSTSSVAASIGELLLEGLKASKGIWVTCDHCKHRLPVQVPDLSTRISAARGLVAELEGTIAAQAKSSDDRLSEALAGKSTLQDLSDDELLVLVSSLEERDPDEDWLRGDVVTAARRIVDAADGLALSEEKA